MPAAPIMSRALPLVDTSANSVSLGGFGGGGAVCVYNSAARI